MNSENDSLLLLLLKHFKHKPNLIALHSMLYSCCAEVRVNAFPIKTTFITPAAEALT